MSSTVKEIKEKTGYLKRSDLYTDGCSSRRLDQGVLTLIGPAILLTGQSAWLAYVAACIWGFMMIAPIPWITIYTETWRRILFSGRRYGRQTSCRYVCIKDFCHRRSICDFMVGIGMYANSLWPQINAKWFGIAA